MEFARPDYDRAQRTGCPEVVLGIGKTPAQIASILTALHQSSSLPAIATKISAPVFSAIRAELPDPLPSQLTYFATAQICALGELPPTDPQRGRVIIASAGTADIPIAEEAAVTLELQGFAPQRLWDVGVAGLHRILDQKGVLATAQVVIVVAGMEGALPSVVAGLVACPVIAVPTSIGYGAHYQGLAPLLAMLNSCAGGVSVVNIDNGFGAAIVAIKILQQLQQP
ncbi:MAG: nickel pincer cofactor biosynthesis protein LarB [Pseudanabaenaceae cyanobacterium]